MKKADHRHARLLRARRKRPRCGRPAKQRNELSPLHVWMAPAWQEIIWRAALRSHAVMCPGLVHGWLPVCWWFSIHQQLGTLMPPSFNQLVGGGEQRSRNHYAERLCGLEVDNQLKLGRPFDR
jgi:hypothetical protein